jgi:hypothetical protein
MRKASMRSLHSNEKLRVFATEAFRSQKSTETPNYSTEVSVETCEIFESVSINPKIRFCIGLCVDYKTKDPGFKPHTAQKRRTKFQSSTRRAETRIIFFTDSIRNQHSKLQVMDFARVFQDPKFQV